MFEHPHEYMNHTFGPVLDFSNSQLQLYLSSLHHMYILNESFVGGYLITRDHFLACDRFAVCQRVSDSSKPDVCYE